MVAGEAGGNPFFVVEMLRHLAESGPRDEHGDWAAGDGRPQMGVPDGVKDVIVRRVARLGRGTHGVLSVAAVVGRGFDLAVLCGVTDLGEDELVETLDGAVRARVIEEVPGAAGRYVFSHALIRETMYGELSATRRSLLHRRVAVALEAAHDGDGERPLDELAHHFAEAATTGDLVKAIAYSADAGERAVGQLAYEQAARHYRRAGSMIDAVERPLLDHQRCDLMIAQGDAERRAGDPRYRATLLRAAGLARALGDPDLLARAALANNRGFFSKSSAIDRERVAVLEAALDACAPGDTTTRASLLSNLAVELVADPDARRRAQLSDDALAMARRMGDPPTLVRTLNYRFVALWGPRTLEARLESSREACGLADRVESPVLEFHAAYLGCHAAIEAGDLALADKLIARAGELAGRLGQPILSSGITRCPLRSAASSRGRSTRPSGSPAPLATPGGVRGRRMPRCGRRASST